MSSHSDFYDSKLAKIVWNYPEISRSLHSVGHGRTIVWPRFWSSLLESLQGWRNQGGVRFQFLLILDLWGISFHAVVVFGLGKTLLFKSVLGHCEIWYDERCFFGKKTAFEIFWPSAIDEIMTKVARTITTLILLLPGRILKREENKLKLV